MNVANDQNCCVLFVVIVRSSKMCTPLMIYLLSMLHLDLRIRDVIVRYATIGTQLSFKK